MRLWKATVEVLIAAQSKPSEDDVETYLECALMDDDYEVPKAVEVTSLDDLPTRWMHRVPFGIRRRTCGEILKEALEKEAWSKPMPNQKELELGDKPTGAG